MAIETDVPNVTKQYLGILQKLYNALDFSYAGETQQMRQNLWSEGIGEVSSRGPSSDFWNDDGIIFCK